MKTPTRLYIVRSADGASRHLVEASNQAQALRAVVRGMFTVEPAIALEVAALMRDGVQPVLASSEQEAA